ncbi:hypothetical protein KI387_031599, partial [Taxus chinensis]
DMELEQSMLPHLEKHGRDTPLDSDEIPLHGERRVVGAHLNPPNDQTLSLGFPNQGRSIVNPFGINGGDLSLPRRYNLFFGTYMDAHSIPMYGGFFGKGANTQGLGSASRSGTGNTCGSGTISQTISAQFSGTLGTLCVTASGPLLAIGVSRGGTSESRGTGP